MAKNTQKTLAELVQELEQESKSKVSIEEIEKKGYVVEMNDNGTLKSIKPVKKETKQEPKKSNLSKLIEEIEKNLEQEYGIKANISQNGNIRSLTLEKRPK